MSNIPNDKRSLDFGSAFSILEAETLKVLASPLDLSLLNSNSIIDDFLCKYAIWIRSTKNNQIKGIDDYPFMCYSNGTSESFDKFYMKNHHRRFRCFKGEYMYHQLAWRYTHSWKYLEDAALDQNDAVVISLPFADTGDMHTNYHQLMTECSKLGVPVLIDCAYFGICQNIEFDLTYKCITDVTFSLSKTFPVAHARIGVRLTREDDDDTMFVYQKIHYNNKLGAALGLRYLKTFTPDYIPSKYAGKQKEFCDILKVKPSKTVLFGIGDERWKEYNRGGLTNRLSFHKQYVEGLEYASTK
jgi:hypothetical protein